MKYFPICLFAFNRPEKLSACIDALLKNQDCDLFELYIFCDGHRTNDEYENVRRVRSIAKNVVGFKKVSVSESSTNKGLENSLIHGLDFVLKTNPGVIVVEDDVIVSRNFLKFINESLNLYENVPEVGSVHGNFLSFHLKIQSTFLLKYSDCWGWGTWRDSWNLMILDSRVLIKLIKETKRVNEFNVFGAYPFFKLLQKQCSGDLESWAIRWHASLFVHNRLSLYSRDSLVLNIGTDGSGVHRDSFRISDRRADTEMVPLTKIPIRPNRLATFIYAFGLVHMRKNLFISAVFQWIRVRNR